MSAGTLPLNPAQGSGLRPVDIRRDLGQIATLMDLCFGDTLDYNGRGAVREMRALARTGPLLWLLGAVSPQWSLGFVWIEDGRLIGNVSTQVSEYDRGAWLIANVAVHPDFRRRGIATALTEAALGLARQHGAGHTLLQVHRQNSGAYEMYRRLGFNTATTRTTWERVSVLEPPRLSLPGIDLRPARAEEWEKDYALVAEARPGGFNWLRPLRPADWRPSLWRRLSNFVAGGRDEHWLAFETATGRLAGAYYLETGFGITDNVNVVVRRAWQGRLERPLFAAALRRLGRRPWSVRVDHPADDEPAEAALREFGFQSTQTLIWMQRDWV